LHICILLMTRQIRFKGYDFLFPYYSRLALKQLRAAHTYVYTCMMYQPDMRRKSSKKYKSKKFKPPTRAPVP
jgi:hypothetical protein